MIFASHIQEGWPYIAVCMTEIYVVSMPGVVLDSLKFPLPHRVSVPSLDPRCNHLVIAVSNVPVPSDYTGNLPFHIFLDHVGPAILPSTERQINNGAISLCKCFHAFHHLRRTLQKEVVAGLRLVQY